MTYSELYSTVKAAFDREGWGYTEVEGREVITCGFEAHHTRVILHVQVFEPIGAISVVSESSLRTDDPLKRDRLAELVMRVNQTLNLGSFELDWDGGQVMYRVTNLFATPQGDIEILVGLVHNTIGEMDRISPMESLIHKSEGPALAGIDIVQLMNRDDLLPDVPLPPDK